MILLKMYYFQLLLIFSKIYFIIITSGFIINFEIHKKLIFHYLLFKKINNSNEW